MEKKTLSGKHLLLYDGSCGLCDAVVQAVIARDKQKCFYFAPLQGKTAAPFIKQLGPFEKPLDSVILVDGFQSPDQKIYLRSRAVWRVLWNLRGIWTVPGLLHFLPGWVFDWAYRLLAKRRYRLFGSAPCRLPSSEDQERFLP